MLPPDQWDSVLSRARGTIYRNTERISSNALLNLLEVGPDPLPASGLERGLSGPCGAWGGLDLGRCEYLQRMGTLRGPVVIGGYRQVWGNLTLVLGVRLEVRLTA